LHPHSGNGEARLAHEKDELYKSLKSHVDTTYDKIKQSQGGLSAVSIGELADKSGVRIPVLQNHLLTRASRGEADLHPTTLIHDDLRPIDKAGATNLPGRNEKAITVTIRNSI
jgi:hypothetical protein